MFFFVLQLWFVDICSTRKSFPAKIKLALILHVHMQLKAAIQRSVIHSFLAVKNIPKQVLYYKNCILNNLKELPTTHLLFKYQFYISLLISNNSFIQRLVKMLELSLHVHVKGRANIPRMVVTASIWTVTSFLAVYALNIKNRVYINYIGNINTFV